MLLSVLQLPSVCVIVVLPDSLFYSAAKDCEVKGQQ
jgi:hypothetical protein